MGAGAFHFEEGWEGRDGVEGVVDFSGFFAAGVVSDDGPEEGLRVCELDDGAAVVFSDGVHGFVVKFFENGDVGVVVGGFSEGGVELGAGQGLADDVVVGAVAFFVVFTVDVDEGAHRGVELVDFVWLGVVNGSEDAGGTGVGLHFSCVFFVDVVGAVEDS